MNSSEWKLLIKYLSDNATSKEREKVENWIRKDPGNKDLFESAKELWELSAKTLPVKESEESWSELSERLDLDSNQEERENKVVQFPAKRRLFKKKYKKAFLQVAAVILIALTGILYITDIGKLGQEKSISKKESYNQSIVYNTIETGIGERKRLRYQDGSEIILNAGSKLTYPNRFSSDSPREVALEGQAYFKVEKAEDWPFIVNADYSRIKVHGTTFSIEAYSNNSKIDVVVEEGVVSVQAKKPNQESSQENKSITEGADNFFEPVILRKGQRSVLQKGRPPKAPESINLEEQLAWLDGEIRFTESTLEEALTVLQRHYDFSYKVKDKSLLDKTFNASFDNEPLKKVIEVLSISLEVEYEWNGNTVVIENRKLNNG